MDFLKFAVQTAISKSSNFPAVIGDKVDLDQSIWTLNNGTKREDGSSCSIFSFDIASNKPRLPLAKNAVKKLRVLRHPGIIKVIDTIESETAIHVITERVVPLRWHIKRKSLSPETLKWGLYSVAKTVKFINDEGASVHGSLKAGTIYTSESGEWKLGGLEVLSSLKDDEAVIYNYGSLVPDSSRYTPPELARSGWETIKRSPISSVDAYNFGVLIYEVFNGDFLGPDQAGQTKNIPAAMQASYKRLINANPKARLSVSHFLEQGQRNGGFFESPLIKLSEGIESLGMKSDEEREHFLNDLDQLSDDFPEDYLRMKILPELIKSIEFGGGGPKVLAVVMKIAAKLTEEDFEAKVTPVVVRLFASPDRAIRVCLLDNLPSMIDRLQQKVVNDKIFPQMVTGFTDIAPVVREQTVKAVLVVITKLSDRTINGELLKYLAKTQNDEQPGIRTNTTICLGKISKHLGAGTRSKVLVAAFSRSLRDPFVHARNAALMALAATADVFGEDDCANRILPAICPTLVDKEKLIRDQANKTLDMYLLKVRKAASSMADTALPPPNSLEATAESTTPRMSTPQSNDAASWTGWAISSFTNKVVAAAGEMQSASIAGRPNIEARPNSAPQLNGRKANSTTASASALHRQAIASPPATSARTSTSSNANEYFQDATDLAGDDLDAWGDMGEDSSFETASDKPKLNLAPVVSVTPYGDNEEPDFAGWLAAQSQKRTGTKPLPKGLTKLGSNLTSTATNSRSGLNKAGSTPNVGAGTEVKKAAITAAKTATTPLVAKKIHTKMNDVSNDDDDGWGDGW